LTYGQDDHQQLAIEQSGLLSLQEKSGRAGRLLSILTEYENKGQVKKDVCSSQG